MTQSAKDSNVASSGTTEFTAEEQHAIEQQGFVLRMVCLPAFWCGFLALVYRWPADTLAVRVILILFNSYVLFCWTSCFHETAHQTLTRWRWLDIAIGRFLGIVMFVPYTAYRQSHIRHHAYVNRPNDWELWPYSNPKCSLAFRRIFVLFDIAFGFVVSPFIYGRIYFHRDSPLKNAAIRRTIRMEYLGIVLSWTFVLLCVAYANVWSGFVECWLIPHMIAGVIQTMRKLTEHLGMSSFDPLLGTRTVIGHRWFTQLCSFANFDIFIHGPHHRHPRLSGNSLKKKMDEYIVSNPGCSYPVYRTYFGATCAMVYYLFRNPGVGVNAGAAPPEEPAGDVTNFLSDVTAEVVR